MASLGRSRDGKSSILEKPLSRGKSEVIERMTSYIEFDDYEEHVFMFPHDKNRRCRPIPVIFVEQ